MNAIKGYAYGHPGLEASPVTLQDLNLLKQTLLWTDEDNRYLNMAGEVLKDQVNEVLDLWYSYVGSHPHLLHYFSKNGQPITDYLAAVRERFGQWILDICQKPHDQKWLDYQYEIARRHHRSKKNQTDKVDAPPLVHYRYMVAFIYPITVTIRSFLTRKNHTQADVDGMYNAWFKAVTLTVILWTYPYINKGEF
jgi:hypothetical protein